MIYAEGTLERELAHGREAPVIGLVIYGFPMFMVAVCIACAMQGTRP